MSEHWPYLTVLLVLMAAGLGLPIPEDIPLLTGGYFCHLGKASLPIMVVVGLAGVMVGDLILFSLGRRFGHHVVEHRFMRRLVNPRRLLLAEELFARHGVKIIFAGRFLPGLRPMIFMAAGVLRVRRAAFVLVDGLAACISVPLLVVLGKVFGGSLERIKHDVRTATHGMALVLMVLALIGAAVWLHRRQKRLLEATPVPSALDPRETVRLAPPPPPGTTILTRLVDNTIERSASREPSHATSVR